jgi:two-component system NtrC family sensor kinase
MPERGKITVRTEVLGDMVRLDVEDAGHGIPKETLEKIFAPFFTTKARGTGLGLAVVKKVLDRHKGRVEVVSTVGKGTCFKLFIPVVQHKPA